MGQSATLYRIDTSDFPKIAESPSDLVLFNITKGNETFQKTHEGLRFVLSKNRSKEEANLVDQIFYPNSTIGVSPDFEGSDPDNLSDDYDFVKLEKEMDNWIHYNNPDVVRSISELLNKISTQEFSSSFDYAELNNEDIYPNNIWNDKIADNIGFNLRDMVIEFIRLKDFYRIANKEGNYILSFVG